MLPRPRPIPLLWRALAAGASLALACSSGGRWGYTKNYAPTPDEKRETADARDLDPELALIAPEKWHGVKVNFYMVVDDRRPGPEGAAFLTGKLHARNEINTCANKFDDESCRVTIKPAPHETVHVLVWLIGGDDVGDLRVGGGTLLRVVGTVAAKPDERDGKVVVQASWYRQWPPGYYAREGELRQ